MPRKREVSGSSTGQKLVSSVVGVGGVSSLLGSCPNAMGSSPRGLGCLPELPSKSLWTSLGGCSPGLLAP